jgi:hypothetical protein
MGAMRSDAYGEYDTTLAFIRDHAAHRYKKGGLFNGFAWCAGKHAKLLVCEGWKIHVAAPEDLEAARLAADYTLPILRELGVFHKLPINMTLLKGLYNKPQETGKFITIYTMSPQETVQVIGALRGSAWARGEVQSPSRIANPRIGGDLRVAGIANVYCRYGAYQGNLVHGPTTGTMVADNRNVGWPPWVKDFFTMASQNLSYPTDGPKGTKLEWNDAIESAKLNNCYKATETRHTI